MSSPNMQKLKAKLDKLQPKAFMTEVFMGRNRQDRRRKLPDDAKYTKGARPSDKPEADRKAIQERVKRREAVAKQHSLARKVLREADDQAL